MSDYIVFAIVLLACIVVFVLLWRRRKSKKARTIGNTIEDQPSADPKDLLGHWLDKD